jgi:hypothetical protein
MTTLEARVSDPHWGIFREQAHSPGRESDDAEILRLTAKHLEAAGSQVSLKTWEEVMSLPEPRPRSIFRMCAGAAVLRRLIEWEASGVRQVNTPLAVLNTYRERMTGRFQEAAVPFIQSRIVPTRHAAPSGPLPVWVKRADVHNTQDGDVVFAATREAVGSALAGLDARGIGRAIIQPHLDGDLIKFYGIGPVDGVESEPQWFRWFYHKGQTVAGHPFDPRGLARLVRQAAIALGLEVYGGDVIATPAGDLVLLDLNAWPSFALYRDEAAAAIAAYLQRRFREAR